jgi:integrase
MGHNSKKMIYEVYGNYVEGLEKDKEKIFWVKTTFAMRKVKSP